VICKDVQSVLDNRRAFHFGRDNFDPTFFQSS